ncbi:MAG TPA: DnaJ domain-containing protein [Mobilitalea sp.]|nr:DnaJ domain-containing protein [Mobilitalea sp.]
MQRNELKQKIRKLKKLELKFRYGFSYQYIEKNTSTNLFDKLPLVWKEFFDLHGTDKKARYGISSLEQMDKEELKQVFDEFWFQVYYRMYQENGIVMMDVQDPELLSFLGLPYDADKSMIKKRFRELCKTYHPDEGGDTEKFMQLMEMMEKFDLK